MHFSEFQSEVDKYTECVHHLRQGASIEEISRTEELLSVNFPNDYRIFLQKWNGGTLFYEQVVIWPVPTSQLADFSKDLVTANNQKWPGMPNSCLTVASYNYGDDICLVPDSEIGAKGEVVLWDHEKSCITAHWASLRDWLTYEMSAGSARFDYNGLKRRTKLEKIVYAIKELFD